MGIMTDCAILPHRRMLPQERTALLGMALIAGLVDGVLDQLRWTGGTMGVVAIGTGNLTFPDRMAGTPETLCPLVLMAVKTDFGLGGPGQDRIVHSYRIMTVGAGVSRRRMVAHMPVHLDISFRASLFTAFMTLQTNFRLMLGRQFFHGDNQGRYPSRFIHMFAHWSMTGLTATVGQGPAVLAVGKCLHEFFMTLQTLAIAISICCSPDFRVEGRPIDVSCF